jgi:phosphatidylglycerophosphate synthase
LEKNDANRRPLKTRSSRWARACAAYLASTSITPDQISLLSIVFAAVGAIALLAGASPWSLVACAICIQLRLACNLLDGMVALEGGRKSTLGSLYNEVPDRVADSMLIVAAGYAAGSAWLGWCGALLAALTAYIRVLGGSLGLAQDFRGPMAKPHRMALLTLGCLVAAGELALRGTRFTLLVCAAVIAAGSLATCVTRLLALARALRDKGAGRP